MDKNIVWHSSLVTREQRESINGHRAAVVWFTGLPGSGKSTLAHEVELALLTERRQALVLDGDNIRHGLSSDLGFSGNDRSEHLRRVGELAKLMFNAASIVLCAFVSPTHESRNRVRAMLPEGAFLEVYCRCPAEVCAQRDSKGFYADAKLGKIANYTGVSAPYEAPEFPALTLDTDSKSVESCKAAIMELLRNRAVIDRI